ncbi:MAG TPA: dockerin type I domain-containing protein [Pirellulales bacterium]|jgi:hypothetical protein
MQCITRLLFVLAIVAYATCASGHGFGLSLTYDAHGNPTGFNVSSQDAFLDQGHSVAGASNLFLEQFGGTLFSDSSGAYYSVIHGFAQTSGPWPPYTATVNVLTPLYFSSGLSNNSLPAVASLAPTGTYIDMWDTWAGNPQPVTNPHPGAAFGDVYINGKTDYYPGFGVSLYDSHELEKDLYIGPGPTNGEYGFAYNLTIQFAGGLTLTTPALVDVFAISDPSTGDFGDNAPLAQQDAATLAIYRASMADVNFDGIVNGLDINLLASHWLQTGSIGLVPGDANRDGIVNGLDINAIASNWEGASVGAGEAVVVPEPASFANLAVGAVLLWAVKLIRPLTCATRDTHST